MKKLFFLFGIMCWTAIGFAQQQDSTKHKQVMPVPDGRYCMALNGGKPQVTLNGKPVKGEVQLKNGTKITPEGTVVKKDGTIQLIKPGSCVNTDGNEVEQAGK